MKKYIFIFFIFAVINSFMNLLCCPCGFSPGDQRPFFEQYDEEIKQTTPDPKEKS